MKQFSTYQCLPEEPMTDRDVLEVGSKFWNEGKWNNFIAPFLPDGKGLTLVDMGCNAGLFLKLAEDKGFQAIGVDSDDEAIRRGVAWRDKHSGGYRFLHSPMQDCLDQLPVADYTVLANAHYYFNIGDWLDYLDKLKYKTRFCIIVTTEKRNSQCSRASADLGVVRSYFKDWEEIGFIDELPTKGDPSPRRLWGLCFKSPLERVPMDLDCGNHVQDKFYEEIDSGKDYHRTRYYRILKGYRKRWSEEQLDKFVTDKITLFEDIKKNGLLKPIIVGSGNRVLDGNHRYSMMKYLGNESILIRRI